MDGPAFDRLARLMGRSSHRRAVVRLLAGLVGGSATGLPRRRASAQSTCLSGNSCTAACLTISKDLHFACDRGADATCAAADDELGRGACDAARAVCQIERFGRDLQCRCVGCLSARQTCCNGACVDLAIDENNCGACGAKCGPGETCDDGACSCGGQSCAFGFCCGGRCVDPGSLRALPDGVRSYRYQPDESELCCEDGQSLCVWESRDAAGEPTERQPGECCNDDEICTRDGCCPELRDVPFRRSGAIWSCAAPEDTDCQYICCSKALGEDFVSCHYGAFVPAGTRSYCCRRGKTCCWSGCCPAGTTCVTCNDVHMCCPESRCRGECVAPSPDYI